MESLSESFSGKRVFVTGHSGFKGSWLCSWLLDLGADVTGFSLAPTTKPALFTQLQLASRVNHVVGDVRDARAVSRSLLAAKPDYVFHLAAQPIVQSAHDNPAETWSTNVMGTVNTLDALRRLKAPCAAVIVTTDKVYARRPRPNVEINALGGTEPYGASKAAAELAVEAWRASFFQVDAVRRGRFPRVAVATARSGNVIGGGDWATDRLVPDIARALGRRKTVVLRNPSAIRPWQHVLDPLAGYLMLAARLRDALTSERATLLQDLSGPFNFGPSLGDHRTVRQVTEEILRHWPGKWSEASTARSAVEVEVLRLHSGKAHKILGWRPKWGFEEAVARTVEWYRMVASNAQAAFVTKKHLADHHG